MQQTKTVLLLILCALSMSVYAQQKVYVTSHPSGAKIFVNGINTGSVTPAEIKITNSLKKKSTEKRTIVYTLKKAGYEDAIRKDRAVFRPKAYANPIRYVSDINLQLIPLKGTKVKPTNKRDFAGIAITSKQTKQKLAVKISPEKRIKDLEKRIDEAVSNENYTLAHELKQEIEGQQRIKDLEIKKEEAVVNENYALAHELKQEIAELQSSIDSKRTIQSTNSYSNNVNEVSTEVNRVSTSIAGNVKVKYHRSSLYTLMISDNKQEHANVIKDAFGNTLISEKFNDHNLGPYLIESKGTSGDKSRIISTYLKKNQVAKKLVAKWFNRDASGAFNMRLIAERGMYDASAFDIQVAQASHRGNAMLEDAGEELIGKTFVIVHDFEFSNKEQDEERRKRQNALAFIPIVNNYSSISAITAKGYSVKATSYLYRLVWTKEIESNFYHNMWVPENTTNPSGVQLFEESTDFRLALVGKEEVSANVNSTIYTKKRNEELIETAMIKAMDKAVANLQRKFAAFRVKSPLHSNDPLSAKIGLKEGDKFEVLEQIISPEGRTSYNKLGVITVDPDNIWDNTFTEEELAEMKKQGITTSQPYTLFKGSNKYSSGLLINQVN